MQHLMGPPSPLSPAEQAKGKHLARLQAALSIPMNTGVNSRRRTAFTIYYTAVVTFPIVVTVACWSFLHPFDFPSTSSFWSRPLLLFLTINTNIVNSVTALAEVLILASVPKQKVIFLVL